MINIKKRNGFTLIATIFAFLIIGAILTAAILSFNTSSDESISNNQQAQAREICLAGLDIMINHMTSSPNDYVSVMNTTPANINFYTEVSVPFATYSSDGSILYNTVDVKINVVGKEHTDYGQVLVATATTTYGLIDKSVDLEILYSFSNNNAQFKRGNILN